MTTKDVTIVTTAEGKVEGAVEQEVLVFKGIPYAAPPVDDLRWRRPQPVTPWGDEVRSAVDYGHTSVQNREACIVGGGGDPHPMHEDCLYLNVWTPHSAPGMSANLPVMVWIHGGAYVMGAGGLPPYIGAPLVKKGAVVVTFNHRLGRMGFFAHPALERETRGGPMNFGLLDQIAALEWVKRNIAAFGGNPDNVTIFGQSAGGKSVLALFCSPLTKGKGLFHKGIAQSVYRNPEPTRALAIKRGIKAATALGLNGAQATLEELRKVDAEKFVAIDGDPEEAKGTANAPNPIVGDEVLPKGILPTFWDSEEAKLPLIIGSNSDDSSVATDFGLDPEQFVADLRKEGINPGFLYPDIKEDDAELGRRLVRDVVFTLLARQIANRHGGDAATYRYYFDYTASGLVDDAPNGTRHGDEIVFALGTGDLCVDRDHDQAGRGCCSLWPAARERARPRISRA